MSQSLESNTLPALPLPDGVILPGMVVTIAVESSVGCSRRSAKIDHVESNSCLIPRNARRV